MKPQSIHRTLVRSLSVSLTLVIIAILLVTDIAVDTWVHGEFERAMENKTKLLTTLVSENQEGIEFDFAGEFMPEFEGEEDPEYFQLWHNSSVFERSHTLELFGNKAFANIGLKLGEKRVKEITLPDGRSGLILYYRFLPQVNSTHRAAFKSFLKESGTTQSSMLIAYAMSAEKLEFIAYLIDISFIVAALIVVLMVRILVTRAVRSGLQPLNELTENIKGMSLADKTTELISNQQVEELQPIQQSLNTFIRENRSLYQKEQRLASDIAHELKTPIAELVSMAEVAIRFPEDKKFLETFTPEVLNVGKRLQHVVSNILLLHRYSSDAFESTDVFDLTQVIQRLIESDQQRISYSGNENIPPLTSNLFAVETILGNLINNALVYSPANSLIFLSASQNIENTVCITITNICTEPLVEEDLKAMFDPLWQKDSARTSTSNFGLGLSIVKSFCAALDGSISVALDNGSISFTVSLPQQPTP
ncbi:ATP-binding protein [Paraglaciecola marina]|uniref:ATP-binding protein n=1 Tax=Paraglaciecola marina TaxID=2500157 RepID=UPI0010614E02|nr:ATP-binding protein [Paraglaciecola marina]